MTEQPQEQPAAEPTQEMRKGYTIPLPKRSEVMDAFRKIVKPAKKKP